MSAAKSEHYVPRLYLRHFVSTDGMLYAYRRESDSSFMTKPDNLCTENYLYEVDMSGFRNAEAARPLLGNYIERRLSSTEGRIAPFYDQLICCCDKKQFSGPEFLNGKLAACYLAANIIVRHPRLLSEERKKASSVVVDVESEGGITEQEQAILNELGIGDNLEPIADLAIMQTLLFSDYSETPFNRLWRELTSKRATIVEAHPLARFITTSLPIRFEGIDEDGHHFDSAYMPLSPRYAMLLKNDSNNRQWGIASLDGVDRLNAALLANVDMWEFAMSGAKGPLDVAVRTWKQITVGTRLN